MNHMAELKKKKDAQQSQIVSKKNSLKTLGKRIHNDHEDPIGYKTV